MDLTYFSSNTIVDCSGTDVHINVDTNEALTPQLFAICKFDGLSDNLPKQTSLSWQRFCHEFSLHKKVRAKKLAPCWSPIIYKAGVTRKNENVARLSMAVLDVDSGVEIESVIKLINGYTYLIHTTYSHSQEIPKYRVILPLDEPIEAAEWNQTWFRINAWLGGIDDPSTKDASRLYFVPSCPLDSIIHFVRIGDGKLLNVSDLPELPVAVKKGLSQSKNWQKPKHIDGIDTIPDDDLGNKAQLEAMQQGCSFIQWASTPEYQPLVSEPLWQAMLSNQCRFEGGEEAAHEASCHHPKYDEAVSS